MRGDIIRRSLQDQNKVGIGRGANTDTSQWDAGVELERRKVTLRLNETSVGVGGAHVSRQPSMKEILLTQQKVKVGEAMKVSEALHVNGRVNGLVDKKEEKRMVWEGEALNQTKAQTKETVSMQWEKSPDQGVKLGPGLNLSYKERLPENLMTLDFKETIKKIDEELGFNPVTEDAVPILVHKFDSFENPLVRVFNSTTDVTHLVKPKEKAHLSEPITLFGSTGSPKVEKKSKVGVPKPKEQGT